MELSSYDGCLVRITDSAGDRFDGECEWLNAEYCEAELGRDEEALQIDNWLFYKSYIQSVQKLQEGAPRFWMDHPLHRMRLASKAFGLVDDGKKTIELRLWDEKRRTIRTGDVIRFESTADETDVVYVRVTGLCVFGSFGELYRALPLKDCGYTERDLASASPADMYKYYSPDEERRWGVVGIRMELL